MLLRTEKITEQALYFQDVLRLAKEAFPPEEYLSPYKLLAMAEVDNFDFWSLLDGDKFIGFMVVQTHKELAYLFFLAIDKRHRSCGYGSRAIATLKQLYSQYKQVVDLEMVDTSAANNVQRESRRAFYLNNGYRATGLFLNYLGVDYEVLCMDDTFEPEAFKSMLATLRVEGFNPKYFHK